ncbi:MAG TPA: hypothetical protein PK230_13270, partial [Chitinophagales bacterium]|nr:hypothetical protein [Chitinophagales bacterium]
MLFNPIFLIDTAMKKSTFFVFCAALISGILLNYNSGQSSSIGPAPNMVGLYGTQSSCTVCHNSYALVFRFYATISSDSSICIRG